jgi:hypothetical protein
MLLLSSSLLLSYVMPHVGVIFNDCDYSHLQRALTLSWPTGHIWPAAHERVKWEHSQIFLPAPEWAYTHRMAPAFVCISVYDQPTEGQTWYFWHIWNCMRSKSAVGLLLWTQGCLFFWVVFPFNTRYNYEKLGASNIGMHNAVKLRQVTRSFPSFESYQRQMKSHQ